MNSVSRVQRSDRSGHCHRCGVHVVESVAIVPPSELVWCRLQVQDDIQPTSRQPPVVEYHLVEEECFRIVNWLRQRQLGLR